jgi:hypothetical protein
MATATTRTRNLRLFLSSGLTAEARANLEILDRLGDTTFLDGTETITFRAKTNLVLQPADENVNGTNGQGTISFATANNKALSMDFWPAVKATFHSPISVNGKLIFTSANATEQTLTINTGSAPRVFTLGGDLTTNQTVSLQSSGSVTATIPSGEQTLVTTTATQNISNKTLDLTNNIVLTGKIKNSDISSNFPDRIDYAKLNLANSIKASDFTTSAGRLQYNQLDLAGQLRNSDWSSDLNHRLGSEKINPDFLTQEITTSGGFSARNALGRKIKILAPNNVPNDYNFILPVEPGIQGQALAMLAQQPGQTEIRLGWVSTGTTILNTGEIYVGFNGNPVNVNPGVLNGSDVIASVASGLTLKPSGVTAGTYGSATQTVTAEVDAKGRVVSLAEQSIAIPSTQITDFAEAVQDVVGSNLVGNSDDITATYDDENDGLTLALASTAITTKTTVTPAADDVLLLSDTSDSGALKKVSLQDVVNLSGASFATTWTAGTTFEVTHNLNSRDLLIQLYDLDTFEDILIDSVKRTTLNTIDLTASVPPTGSGWRVLIKRT